MMKGSYTVEASWIMSITLCILCATILVAFQVYREVIADVIAPITEIDAVALFYQRDWISGLLEGVN